MSNKEPKSTEKKVDTPDTELQLQVEKLQAQLSASQEAEKAAQAEISKLKEGADFAEEVEETPRVIPKFYSGKVRGTYAALRRAKQHPFIPELKFGVDNGISNKQVGKVELDSWLDIQLQAGVIRFEEEA